MSIKRLPNELIYNILIELPLPSLLNFCEINKNYREICRDDIFWKYKTFNDFPEKANFRTDNYEMGQLSWKEYYIKLYNSKEIPVVEDYSGHNIIGTFTIYKDETLGDILNRLKNIVAAKAAATFGGYTYSIFVPMSILDKNHRNIISIRDESSPLNYKMAGDYWNNIYAIRVPRDRQMEADAIIIHGYIAG